MKLTEWVARFSALHERAKKGELKPFEKKAYVEAQDELAAALLKAQRGTIPPGQKPREALRVARALPVEFEMASGWVAALTQEISAIGFSALVSAAPAAGALVRFRLRPAKNADALAGFAKVSALQEQAGSVRVTMAYENQTAQDRARIEFALFDAALEIFGGKPKSPSVR